MPTYQLLQGHAIHVLRALPPESVNMVWTSPPYFGLRKYKIAPIVWGGDPGCDHAWGPNLRTPWANEVAGPNGRAKNTEAGHWRPKETGPFCQKCGAWYGDLGQEPDVDMYVAHLVEIFREVRRVLHRSGTVWLNLGDSYGSGSRKTDKRQSISPDTDRDLPIENRQKQGFAKQLIGIPWRVALALQADGWFLRSDIIWDKPDPIPSSVRDRPTLSHEHLFLLARSERYFYDIEAIKEPVAASSKARYAYAFGGKKASHLKETVNRTMIVGDRAAPQKRNKRTVWRISTGSSRGGHYAVASERLVEPCIKAGASVHGICPKCRAPWERIVERIEVRPRDDTGRTHSTTEQRQGKAPPPEKGWEAIYITKGWQPGCTCQEGGGPALLPDDLEYIATPLGERAGEDPSLVTGRAGFNRPRGESEGQRPITRYEQRAYARQLRHAPTRAQMEAEAGPAFAHYIRTDRSGARPIPPELLAAWLERGWLDAVTPPRPTPPAPVPAVVMDIFAGVCTTGRAAVRMGRDFIGIDLSEEYLANGKQGIEQALTQPRLFQEEAHV